MYLHLDILQSSFHLSMCCSLFWWINEHGNARWSLCNGTSPIYQLSSDEFLFGTPVLHHSRALSSAHIQKKVIIIIARQQKWLASNYQCHDWYLIFLPFRLDWHRCYCKIYSINLAMGFRATHERFQWKLHSAKKNPNEIWIECKFQSICWTWARK